MKRRLRLLRPLKRRQINSLDRHSSRPLSAEGVGPCDARLSGAGITLFQDIIMRQRTRYSAVAMLLHWSIAALIIANLFLGWRMGFLKGLAQFDMFQLHKSVGITVLVLSIVRLVWRMLNPVPPLPAGMKGWEVAAAHVTHWAFYGLMIGLPLTGWTVVSVSPWN